VWVFIGAFEPLLEPLGLEGSSHPALRLPDDPGCGLEVAGFGRSVRQALRHRRPALASHLDKEIVPIFIDQLREREVEAGTRAGPRPHGVAETGAGRGSTVHDDQEGGLAAPAVAGIGARLADEDTVLHRKGRELAGPHPHEGVAG
jgi:hypothetical protein